MVALSARRLVCAAISLISRTTSPIAWAETRKALDLAVGVGGLCHGLLRDGWWIWKT